MKVREVIRIIEADGWYLVRTTGSHRHYRHDSKPGLVTVAGHPNETVPPGTLSSIWRQAGIKPRPR